MVDPIDSEAIEELEKTTGCKVQAFVGIISDIIHAIEQYYKVRIKNQEGKKKELLPLVIRTKNYRGFDRRKSVRLKVESEIHFPDQEQYKKSKIKDISSHGFLFESENILPIGAYTILQINLPKEFSPSPISVVVQIARVVPLAEKGFDIGAKIVKIPQEDLQIILRYAKIYKNS